MRIVIEKRNTLREEFFVWKEGGMAAPAILSKMNAKKFDGIDTVIDEVKSLLSQEYFYLESSDY